MPRTLPFFEFGSSLTRPPSVIQSFLFKRQDDHYYDQNPPLFSLLFLCWGFIVVGTVFVVLPCLFSTSFTGSPFLRPRRLSFKSPGVAVAQPPNFATQITQTASFWPSGKGTPLPLQKFLRTSRLDKSTFIFPLAPFFSLALRPHFIPASGISNPRYRCLCLSSEDSSHTYIPPRRVICMHRRSFERPYGRSTPLQCQRPLYDFLLAWRPSGAAPITPYIFPPGNMNSPALFVSFFLEFFRSVPPLPLTCRRVWLSPSTRSFSFYPNTRPISPALRHSPFL